MQWLKKYASTEFGVAFDYNRVYFVMLDNCLVNVEENFEGECQKYAYKTRKGMVPPDNELGTFYEKVQTLDHYSYFMSAGKLMLVALHGAAFNLHDPEIATLELQRAADQKLYFCAGIHRRQFLKISEKIANLGYFAV